MSRFRRAVHIGAWLLLAACRTPSGQQEVPALIVEPTPESRAELLRVVTAALDGAPVTLADDALTESSLLNIERSPPRDLQGRPLTGRELDRPLQFRLLLSDSQCVLLRESDGSRWTLAQTRCVPE